MLNTGTRKDRVGGLSHVTPCPALPYLHSFPEPKTLARSPFTLNPCPISPTPRLVTPSTSLSPSDLGSLVPDDGLQLPDLIIHRQQFKLRPDLLGDFAVPQEGFAG